MSLYLNIEKRLGDFQLRVNLETGDDVLALLGGSGCGKSLTLKCIAGIENPDKGRIIVDGNVFFDSEKKINLSPQKRRAGLIFQNYALFPNMTVEANILCATRRDSSSATKQQRSAKVKEIMESFGISQLARHYPSQLSGGQQQRAALARTLVSSPDILLLDEPFSALDSHLRFHMEKELRDIMHRFGKTVVLVSHDRDEVFRLCDKIAVMDDGEVDVYGSKEAVFDDPKTLSGAILTGCKNISPIHKLDEHHALAKNWGLTLQTSREVGDAEYIGIRMHDVRYAGASDTNKINNKSISDGINRIGYKNDCLIDETDGFSKNIFSMEVSEVVENPFSYTVMLRGEYKDIGWETDKPFGKTLRPSETVRIQLPPDAILLLKK